MFIVKGLGLWFYCLEIRVVGSSLFRDTFCSFMAWGFDQPVGSRAAVAVVRGVAGGVLLRVPRLLSVYPSIYLHLSTYMYTCIYIQVNIYIHIHIHICISTYVYVCT